jgi:hypothetical protein
MVVQKLSRLQKQILLNLHRFIRKHEKHGDDSPEVVRYRRVPLTALRGDEPKGRADSAAFSRAVRRLEARGLLLRINRRRGDLITCRIRRSAREPAPRRSDCLVLTKRGQKAAKWILQTGG